MRFSCYSKAEERKEEIESEAPTHTSIASSGGSLAYCAHIHVRVWYCRLLLLSLPIQASDRARDVDRCDSRPIEWSTGARAVRHTTRSQSYRFILDDNQIATRSELIGTDNVMILEAIAIERRMVLPIVVHFELSAPPVPSQTPNHAHAHAHAHAPCLPPIITFTSQSTSL